MNDQELKQFIKERDSALLSLNKEKIMAYMKRYNIIAMPSDEKVFWSGIHKAILNIKSATTGQKNKSRVWLKKNGFNCHV